MSTVNDGGLPPIPNRLGGKKKPTTTTTMPDINSVPVTFHTPTLTKNRTRPTRTGPAPTAYDVLDPKYREQLTGEAAQILSTIPVYYSRSIVGAGQYRPAGANVQDVPAESVNDPNGYLVINPNKHRDEAILHEALHAFDAVNGYKPSTRVPGLPYSQETGIYTNYWMRPNTNVTPTVNIVGGQYVSGLPATEEYATLGMYGSDDLSEELRRLFEGFFR